MCRLFRKKREPSQMELLLDLAIDDLKDEWISYIRTKQFKNDVSLSENIDCFAQQIVNFFKERYMTLYQFDKSIFWYSVSNAIIRAETHPKYEVNLAIRELDARYK